MIRTDALPTRPRVRAERLVSNSLSVLIEVPEVKASVPIRRRRRVVDPQHDWRRSSRPPRRRLRREVRVVGCALLAFLPLLSACTLGWQSRSSQLLAASISDVTAEAQFQNDAPHRPDRARPANSAAAEQLGRPSVVVLSIEPAVGTPGPDTEIPVVFPGYVLPDDNFEESSHAGS
jgi:hypothetical protein